MKRYLYFRPPRVSEIPDLPRSFLMQDISDERVFVPSFTQEFNQLYSRDQSPKSVLIYHGLGSGKTATGVRLFVEAARRGRKGLLVLPMNALKKGWLEEIFSLEKHDRVVKRFSADPDLDYSKFHASGIDYTKRAKGYNPEASFLVRQQLINRTIGEDIHMKGYRKMVMDLRSQKAKLNQTRYIEYIRDTYDGKFMIIDEVHALRKELANPEGEFLDIFRYARDIQLAVLTATPVFDSPREIVGLLGLLLLNDAVANTMTEDQAFDQNDALTPEGEQWIRESARGRVSYFSGGNPLKYPVRLSKGSDLFPSEGTLSEFVMLKIKEGTPQHSEYNRLFETKDSITGREKSQALRRQALTLTYPTGTGLVAYKAAFEAKPDDPEKYAWLKNIGDYSVKFKYVLDNLSTQGINLVFIENLASAQVFSFCLEILGMRRAKSSTEVSVPSGARIGDSRFSGDKYITFHDITNEAQIKSLRQLVNAPDNRYGDLVRVVVATRKLSTGVSFKCIRQLFICDTKFNLASHEQTAGRAIRFMSHQRLGKTDRNVVVHQLAAVHETHADDQTAIDIIRRKKTQSQRIENILKSVSYDCCLNLEYNQDDYLKRLVRLYGPEIRDSTGRVLRSRKTLPGIDKYTCDAACTDTQGEISYTPPRNDEDDRTPVSIFQLLRDYFLVRSAGELDDVVRSIRNLAARSTNPRIFSINQYSRKNLRDTVARILTKGLVTFGPTGLSGVVRLYRKTFCLWTPHGRPADISLIERGRPNIPGLTRVRVATVVNESALQLSPERIVQTLQERSERLFNNILSTAESDGLKLDSDELRFHSYAYHLDRMPFEETKTLAVVMAQKGDPPVWLKPGPFSALERYLKDSRDDKGQLILGYDGGKLMRLDAELNTTGLAPDARVPPPTGYKLYGFIEPSRSGDFIFKVHIGGAKGAGRAFESHGPNRKVIFTALLGKKTRYTSNTLAEVLMRLAGPGSSQTPFHGRVRRAKVNQYIVEAQRVLQSASK